MEKNKKKIIIGLVALVAVVVAFIAIYFIFREKPVEGNKEIVIKVVDSDDWVELNMIEELVHHLKGVEKEVICSNYIIEKTEIKGCEKTESMV